MLLGHLPILVLNVSGDSRIRLRLGLGNYRLRFYRLASHSRTHQRISLSDSSPGQVLNLLLVRVLGGIGRNVAVGICHVVVLNDIVLELSGHGVELLKSHVHVELSEDQIYVCVGVHNVVDPDASQLRSFFLLVSKVLLLLLILFFLDIHLLPVLFLLS